MARRKLNGQRVNYPPEGSAWVYHTRELISSMAWRGMSINCRRLIDALEVEHLSHGGTENGSLIATYNQLAAFGIGRQYISGAIKEAATRGLIRVEHGARRGTVESDVNRFRITYFWSKTRLASGLWDWKSATNDWQHFTPKKKAKPTAHVRMNTLQTGTVTVPKGELGTVPKGELALEKRPENTDLVKVPKGRLPSISGAGGHSISTTSEPGAGKPKARVTVSVNRITDSPDTWTQIAGAALPCLTALSENLPPHHQSWPLASRVTSRDGHEAEHHQEAA